MVLVGWRVEFRVDVGRVRSSFLEFGRLYDIIWVLLEGIRELWKVFKEGRSVVVWYEFLEDVLDVRWGCGGW